MYDPAGPNFSGPVRVRSFDRKFHEPDKLRTDQPSHLSLGIYQVGSIELSDKLIPDISKTVNFTACLTSPDSPLTLKII